MAKDWMLPIDERYLSLFFKPIRDKKDIIYLLMNTIKYVTTELRVDSESDCYIHIVVDDMNRFIYQSKDKVFSVRSPFNVSMGPEGELFFYSSHVPVMDGPLTSKILLLLNDEKFESPNSLDFLSLLEEVFEEEADRHWALVRELLSFEDGYLRFDHDRENENGKMHPLTHLDICYSTASTYKIGTYRTPCAKYLKDLLNTKTNAFFLEK